MATKKLCTLLTVFLSIVGTKAFAYDFSAVNADGVTIYYNYINEGSELEVTFGENPLYAYNSPREDYEGAITIPEEVTFMNRTRKVTSIGWEAFRGCYKLTSIILPNSLKSIKGQAFLECTALVSITIPNSVTDIGGACFSGCTSLPSISIPNGVTTFYESTFYKCTELTSIILPNNLTSIGKWAFRYCDKLKSITIPNSLTTIEYNAFEGCSNLKKVIVNDISSWCGINFSTLLSNPLHYANHLYSDENTEITNIVIPNTVTAIGDYAFEGVSMLNIVSQIENPFRITGKESDSRVFSKNTFLNATLYVPIGTINKYKETEGWKDFAFIEEGDGGMTPSDTKKCTTPTISYHYGKLTFNSDTEGAIYHSTVTDDDIKSYDGNEIQLGVTYIISVYATKEGYQNSETATATLCWIDVSPKTEGITDDIAHIAARAVMIKAESGQLTIEGAEDNTNISVYSLDGIHIGTTTSRNGVASINASFSKDSVAIVKIGNKSVKVMMK